MKFKLLLALSFLIGGIAYSQVITQYHYPSTVPSQYNFDPSNDYLKLSKLKVKGTNSVDVSNYAEMVAYGKTELFKSGQIYLDWVEMESYLKKVLNKILPDSIKGDIYLVKNPNYNAFTIHDGSLFINIGLLADVYNEASLAIIIGHELAHYLNKDVQDSYFKNLKKFSKKNRNKSKLNIEFLHENQEREIEADSLGFLLSNNAGYDIRYGLNNFYHFLLGEISEENKTVRIKTVNSKNDSLQDVNKILLSTHPKAKDRISFLTKQISKDRNAGRGKDFLISEIDFQNIQEKARYEVLLLHLNNNDFHKCIEKSFEYHLLYPENGTYIYYILEGIRRLLYIKNDKEDDGFLTENYSAYFEKGEGILNNLNFLLRDSLKYSKVRANDLISKEISFNTYGEAFNYFKDQAIKKNIKESYLTMAIHYKDSTVSDAYIKTYMSFPDALYPKYAECLLTNSLLLEIENNTNESLFFNDITFLEDHFYGYHNNLINKYEKSINYYNKVVELLEEKFPNKMHYFSQSIKDENLERYILTNEIINNLEFFNSFLLNEESKTATEHLIFNEEENLNKKKNSIFILNPDVWNYFEENNIFSIESINIINYDDHTALINTIGNTILNITLLPFGVIYQGGKIGSNRYAYNVSYKRFNLKKEAITVSNAEVHYQMRIPHLKSSVYELLNNAILDED